MSVAVDILKLIVFLPKWAVVDPALETQAGKALQRGAARSKKKVVRMARTLIRANHRAKQSVKIAIISSLPGATDIILPDPPVPRLLISNQPPTESELALISESIQAAQAEATRLSETLNKTKSDREISRALELVTIYKLEAANQFIRQHQGIISIVRRLPVEILQEVFLWVATSLFEPNAWSSPRSFVIYNSGPQWNLAQICHSWRTIALNISSLWKLPSITLDDSGTRSKLQLQCIKELLRRSNGQPLHLNITCSYDFEGESHPVLNFLCQYAESWETLCVKLPCKAFAALRSLRGRLPALRRIDLSTSSWSWTWSVVEPNDCFQSAPLLTTVYVESPLRAMFPLPFKQLLHYTEDHGIGLTSPTNWTPPNFDFHALTMLSLTFYSDGYVFPHIALPFLVSLEIRVFHNCPTMRSCFDYLKVPAIQILRITADYDNTMPSLARMLNNSSPCPLKKLTLRHPKRVRPNELSELLLFAPELDTLSVNLPMSSYDILNLAYGYKHQPLVPLLRTCAFHHYKCINERETTDAAVMDALNMLARSRCEDRYKIESDFSIMSIERLEAFEDFKLSISFEHFEGPMLELHASFNNWSPSTTTSNTLLSLKSELLEVVPRLRQGYCSLDHPALARNRKVNDILNSIESMLVGDVRDIVFTGSAHLLQRMISSQHKTLRHCQSAERILFKWKTLLSDPVSLRHRHWMIQDPISLVYIANENPLRTQSMGAIFMNSGELDSRVSLELRSRLVTWYWRTSTEASLAKLIMNWDDNSWKSI